MDRFAVSRTGWSTSGVHCAPEPSSILSRPISSALPTNSATDRERKAPEETYGARSDTALNSRGSAIGDAPVGNVVDDDRAGSDHAVGPDAALGDHPTPESHERARSDLHAPGKAGSGCDVGALIHRGLVIHDRACVDDHTRADHSLRADDCARAHYRAFPDPHVGLDDCRGMSDGRKREAAALEP